MDAGERTFVVFYHHALSDRKKISLDFLLLFSSPVICSTLSIHHIQSTNILMLNRLKTLIMEK